MIDLKGEVGRFNTEFAKLQELFQQALTGLKGEPEFGMAQEMTETLTAKHAEWQKGIGPAIDWLEKEHKELEHGLAETEARIAEVEKELNAALAEAEKPQPAPPPAPPPLVPGEGDPRYGFELGAELLALLGLGSKAASDAAQPKLGEVWQLESVDWKVDSTPEQPPRPATPPAQPPAQSPPSKSPPDHDKSLGQSIDWNE